VSVRCNGGSRTSPLPSMIEPGSTSTANATHANDAARNRAGLFVIYACNKYYPAPRGAFCTRLTFTDKKCSRGQVQQHPGTPHWLKFLSYSLRVNY
jgi:hypothetical protein